MDKGPEVISKNVDLLNESAPGGPYWTCLLKKLLPKWTGNGARIKPIKEIGL